MMLEQLSSFLLSIRSFFLCLSFFIYLIDNTELSAVAALTEDDTWIPTHFRSHVTS
jgi:hypothetical protein